MMICRLEVERMVFSYLIYMLMVNFVIFGYFAGWKVLNLKLEPKEYMKDVNFVRLPCSPLHPNNGLQNTIRGIISVCISHNDYLFTTLYVRA